MAPDQGTAVTPGAFADLCRAPGSVLFDTARGRNGESGSLLFAGPVDTFEALTIDEVPRVLAQADASVEAGYHVAGFLAYEAGAGWCGVPPRHPGTPLVWFGVYREAMPVAPALLDAAVTGAPPAIHGRRLAIGRGDYLRRVARIRDHIREGDVYQVNFTTAFDLAYSGDPFALYRRLRRNQRVAYGAFIPRDAGAILSFSPELFFRIDNGTITARPMKGTARRGPDGRADAALRAWLQSDEKNRAENLMIVDLLRNDLSRVCAVGSVQVPALFTLEAYETLYQMTSTVTGRLEAGTTLPQLFEALYPCGSITGAPKRSAMRLIHDLEAAPRGLYCGAIGFMTPARDAVFNVAIRTLTLANGRGTMGTGSGIVWDSDAASEYDECLLKGAFLDGGRP